MSELKFFKISQCNMEIRKLYKEAFPRNERIIILYEERGMEVKF